MSCGASTDVIDVSKEEGGVLRIKLECHLAPRGLSFTITMREDGSDGKKEAAARAQRRLKSELSVLVRHMSWEKAEEGEDGRIYFRGMT